MYFYGLFQCVNFFILLRQSEAITWENFVLAKRDTGCTRDFALPGLNFLHAIAYY